MYYVLAGLVCLVLVDAYSRLIRTRRRYTGLCTKHGVLLSQHAETQAQCNTLLSEGAQKHRLYTDLRARYTSLHALNGGLEKVRQAQKVAETLAAQKTQGFPWLAEACADHMSLVDKQAEDALLQRRRPALKARETVKKIRAEKKALAKELKVLQHILKYWSALFPFLQDFAGNFDDDILSSILGSDMQVAPSALEEIMKDPSIDRARYFMSADKYQMLSGTERNQLALDRYMKRSKTNAEIGAAYERYVGYLFERDGYDVQFQGIFMGFEDLGRDLIAKKGPVTYVIQCKCWSLRKVIRENAINQLYGTTAKYQQDHPEETVKAAFYTSTRLSETAAEFATSLGVVVREEVPLPSKYPIIKCVEGSGKIYHLPFDQQYDKIKGNRAGRFFVTTVQEAEDQGFRRAYRWSGATS